MLNESSGMPDAVKRKASPHRSHREILVELNQASLDVGVDLMCNHEREAHGQKQVPETQWNLIGRTLMWVVQLELLEWVQKLSCD